MCIAIMSCGLCSSSITLCSKCEISTLKANGFDVSKQSEITGLNQFASGYSGFYRSQYSDLGKKLQELYKISVNLIKQTKNNGKG